MVLSLRALISTYQSLSVLALSSRFDGPQQHPAPCDDGVPLSVLALSSRFDGPPDRNDVAFAVALLSVLALSSRFDGPSRNRWVAGLLPSFSTRSVESF